MQIKRVFDFCISFLTLVSIFLGIIFLYIIASIDTQSNGFFTQKRVGQFGKIFTIFKIKTMHPKTRSISAIGKFLRKSKLDELPQLWNVLIGDMSFVGPRPDIIGYADQLLGEDRIIVNVKPGLTGLASIKYRNEEKILAQKRDPLHYNDTIVWPDKVKINKWYVKNRNLMMDAKILFYTLFPADFNCEVFMQKNSRT